MNCQKFGEEIMRVFVFERIRSVFSKSFLAISIILYSIYFGIWHMYQGNIGFISAIFFSLFIFLLYVWKRNFYLLFIVHFLYDLFVAIVPPKIL